MSPRVATRRALLYSSAAAANWWEVAGETCVAAYQPKGAASLAASYTNLANPGTYDLTLVASGPAWSSGNGWECNGFNDILDTGIVPSSGWTLIVRFSSAAAVSSNDVAGILNAGGGQRFYVRAADSPNRHLYGYGTSIVGTGNLTAGVMAVTSAKGYLDGSPDVTMTGSWVATALSIYINGVSGANNNFNGNVQAVAIYSDTLDDSQIASLSTAMAAL